MMMQMKVVAWFVRSLSTATVVTDDDEHKAIAHRHKSCLINLEQEEDVEEERESMSRAGGNNSYGFL